MKLQHFNNKGYTLIELLTATIILVTISSIITAIIVSVLQGSAKSRVTTTVAQNANFALSAMTDIINSSQGVQAIGGTDVTDCINDPYGDSITLLRNDGGLTTLTFDSGTISSSSAQGSVNLIDTSTVALDTTDTPPRITCKQASPYSMPIIDIEFALRPAGTSGKSTAFATQVLMRNFQSQ